ncbi:SDR family NAD(P)-dependent oxidoreductase [Actinomadura atramentaria]|uniref:SDR family NAD(P)-dependent oxidoreductase n=1 Tax=Actinomadura atramentaria TaxID=1990 RepID=UPI00036019D6|nr:SDR family NAD(P)-dependent oxidoreductase [Actinomadura atramentaria]
MGVRPFDGALAVVTGAGGGLGRATALALAERGARVVAADLDLPSAERTAELVGGPAAAYRVDVSDATAMAAFAETVRADHRVPDIVVNNAGVAASGPLLDTPDAVWEKTLGVNLYGVVNGCRLFGRQMADRVAALPARPEKPNFGGHIVNIASIAAFTPSRNLPAYCTSKAAVLTLSACLRAELASSRIGVTAVCPGVTRTGILAGADLRLPRHLHDRADRLVQAFGQPPEKVAERIADAIVRNRAVVPVGPDARLLRVLSRATPGALRLLARVPAPAP